MNDDESKTCRTSDGTVYWKPGDEINVFFKSDGGKFTSTNKSDAAIASFTGSLTVSSVIGMTEGASDENYIWGLYPYDSGASCDGASVTTTFPENQTGVAGTFDDDLFITLAKSNSFSLGFYNVLSGLKFTVSKEGIKSISLSGNDGEKLAGVLNLIFGKDGKPCVQDITDSKSAIYLTPENDEFAVGEVYYILLVPNFFEKGITVTMTTDTEMGKMEINNPLEFSRNSFRTVSDMDKYAIFSPIVPVSVDLGLSVKWRSCNLGANKPEELGGFYQWAGLQDVKSLDIYLTSDNYPYRTAEGLTKYCSQGYRWAGPGSPDFKEVLDSEDDAAHVILGGNWHMPTREDWAELVNNCQWSWTENYNNTGISGQIVTSTKPGYTNKSIFLPVTGGRQGNYMVGYLNGYGLYWTTLTYKQNPEFACAGYFNSKSVYSEGSFERYTGLPIRPVSD